MQRLFSTFAGGWPGVGLLVQRLVAGTALLACGIHSLNKASQADSIPPQVLGAAAGVLLVIGLWTPIAGSLAAIVEGWALWSGAKDPWVSISLAVFGATLAMIGPGAFSIDARLFGRKHIEPPLE